MKQPSVICRLRLNKNLFFSKLIFLTVCISLHLCFSLAIAAQDNEQKDTAPPPLKVLSKDETRQLEVESDIKKRTKLALELMEIRLKKAETFNSQEQYSEMFNELGGFHALVDRTLEFLDFHDNGGGRVLNNFKRMELALRAFLPRLELIRRDLPPRYELYVRNLASLVRRARSRAIDPLFGETVVKDNNN